MLLLQKYNKCKKVVDIPVYPEYNKLLIDKTELHYDYRPN